MLEISKIVPVAFLEAIKARLKENIAILIQPPDYINLPMIYIKLEEYRVKNLPLLNYYEVKIFVEIFVKPDDYKRACYLEIEVQKAIKFLKFENIHIILLNNEKIASVQGSKPQHLLHSLHYNMMLQEL